MRGSKGYSVNDVAAKMRNAIKEAAGRPEAAERLSVESLKNGI